jgi:hypothetical protein
MKLLHLVETIGYLVSSLSVLRPSALSWKSASAQLLMKLVLIAGIRR